MVKIKRKVKEKQKHFIDVVKRNGAIAGVAHSVEEAIDIIENGVEDYD